MHIKMTPNELNLFTEQLIQDAAFGLGLLAIILLLNVFFSIRIFIGFRNACSRSVKVSQFHLVSRFMIAVLLICVAQVLSIHLWAAAIYALGLIENFMLAVLFTGSCYTTLGIYSDTLPIGWRTVAFYIAFSGLFSFAMATSAMISMLGIIAKKIDTSAK